MESEIATDTTPARSEARAPQITRASTSRPISSVPNQCCQLGALRTALQLAASGSYGAIHGARSASSTKNTTMTSPTMAPRRRARRRNARCAGVSSRGATSMGMAMAATSSPHARVHHEVGEVRQQVERDVGGGREKHHTLHPRIFAIEHRINDKLDETVKKEDHSGQ